MAGADGGGSDFSLGFGLRIVESGRLEPARRGKRIERGGVCHTEIVMATTAVHKAVMATAGAVPPSRRSRNAARRKPAPPAFKTGGAGSGRAG